MELHSKKHDTIIQDLENMDLTLLYLLLLHVTGLSDLFTTKAGVLPPSQRTIRYSYSSRKAPRSPPPSQI
ncbi:hypothetical protein Tsubulata_043870 [Turnera subulata]|uniref:Uncharacterized protein n=1 Tax=Turnera subulata TaxID=218843 RepID=A0A9Q0GF83_9ROSI|nr:hypothetical protein Tsubulata_043870 [Turnera subulata]